jgi:peptide/nickel transport system substrate-binding protein
MLRAPRFGSDRGRRGLVAGLAAAGLALVAAACGPASAGSSAGAVGTTPVSGGTATYAEEPGFPIDYIFPFTSSAYIDVANTDEFQYMLYRPLYWFGKGTEPYLNESLSLAYPPQYKGQLVTIRLKKYKWSNGKPVTAQNVMFWINMQLEDSADWGAQVANDFPFNASNIRVVSSTELQMTMNKPFSSDWFTYNELSQITPMPEYWDRTSATTPSHCSNDLADCTAVYTYLDSQAKANSMSSWGSSPLWSVVDGPFRVQSATSDGEVTMVFNNKYSGPVAAHHISKLIELPFSSEEAEFNVLQDPGRQPVDVGYLPTVDAPVPAPGAQSGGNPDTLPNYQLTAVYPWALSYFPYNYNDPTAGPIFKQLYFREAFQSLVDQEGVIDGPLHGYGKATIGPVADYPVTQFLSTALEAKGDPWELNLSRAESLLSQNGWSVVTNGGVDRCIRPGSGPGDCGAGVKPNQPLTFSFMFASGVDWMYSAAKELVSNASLVGIHVNATATPPDTIVGDAFCSPAPGQPPCPSWQLAQWGEWTYSPDYLPTGEELFENSSVADAGVFKSSTDNALIQDTLMARTSGAFDRAMYVWQDWLAKDLPVVYEPNAATLVENVDNLHIGPQSTTFTINPEDWYYLK